MDDFIDTAQSVESLLATAQPSDKEATQMRLFAFAPEGTKERLALTFIGPEAAKLASVFVMQAEALFDVIESRRGVDTEE